MQTPYRKHGFDAPPILCLADTLAFLFEICRLRFFHDLSLRGAVGAAVGARHKHTPDGTDKLATMTGGKVIRWLFFILGGHGCVLGIGGAENMPWTQLWGFSYVASFLVFETMLLMVPKGLHQDLEAQRKQLYIRRFPAHDRTMSLSRHAFAATSTANFALLCYPAVFLVASILNTEDKVLRVQFAMHIVGMAFIVLTCVCNTVGVHLFKKLAAAHPGIAEKICILHKPEAELIRSGQAWYDTWHKQWRFRQFGRDTSRRSLSLTLWPLGFFTSHLALGLLWYRSGYNPSGTKSAGWTSMFG